MRKGLVLLLLLSLLTLTACYDAVDLNEQIFAVNMALDTGEAHALRLTLQYPQITPVGKDSGSSGGGESELSKDGYLIAQVEGEDLPACLELMQLATPRRLDLMQLRGVFISESIARDRETLLSCLAALTDAHSARPTASVFVSRGRAEDVLMGQTPLFGARLSKAQAALMAELLRQGVVPASPLSLFYDRLTGSARSASAALCALNGMQYVSTPSPRGVQSTAYLAGDLPRNTVSTVDYCGSAVFGPDGMLLLDGYEAQLCALLTGDLKSMGLIAGGRSAQLTFSGAPHITVDLGDAQAPLISICVKLHPDAPDPDAQRYAAQLEQDITALLLKLQQSGMDPIGFSERARMSTATFSDWEALDWPARYAKACFLITVES